MFETILPNNATPFEKNLEHAANFADMPIGNLSHLSDPWTIDARYLPWLAYRFSIEIWNDNWSEQKKRSVIAKAIELQRIKGTEKGLREYVDLADGEVKQIVVPPQRTYLSAGISKDQMDDWLRTMPQIRVHMASKKGDAKGFSFYGKSFLNHSYSRYSMGPVLYGRDARLWDKGIETPLQVINLTTAKEQRKSIRVERYSISGDAGRAAFYNKSFISHGFLGGIKKQAELVTIRQDTEYEHSQSQVTLQSAVPSLQPISIRSERISEEGNAGYSAYCGRFLGRNFLTRSNAEWMMYDRIVLHDPNRATPRLKSWSFFGHSRLGMPPYNAEVVIDLKDKKRYKSAYFNKGFLNAAFLYADDQNRIKEVHSSVVISKATRDKILVTHQLQRRRTFADGLPLDGSITFDSYVPYRL